MSERKSANLLNQRGKKVARSVSKEKIHKWLIFRHLTPFLIRQKANCIYKIPFLAHRKAIFIHTNRLRTHQKAICISINRPLVNQKAICTYKIPFLAHQKAICIFWIPFPGCDKASAKYRIMLLTGNYWTGRYSKGRWCRFINKGNGKNDGKMNQLKLIYI